MRGMSGVSWVVRHIKCVVRQSQWHLGPVSMALLLSYTSDKARHGCMLVQVAASKAPLVHHLPLRQQRLLRLKWHTNPLLWLRLARSETIKGPEVLLLLQLHHTSIIPVLLMLNCCRDQLLAADRTYRG